MDSRHLSRLQEEQQKAILETEKRIQQCEKFKSDYKALQSRLKTLPDSVSHNIMVPFGKLGFMPGQLVHTNEVLVLLGDNWFAERSAKQAGEIAGRRISELDKQIKELQDQMRLLAPRLGFTTELQSELEGEKDVKEIVEEYDEEKEKLWNEQHKINVRRHREQLRQNEALKEPPSTESKKDSSKVPTDEELWSQLEELERQEEEQGDLDSSEKESDKDERETVNTPADLKSQVTWADERRDSDRLSKSPTDSDDDADNESEGEDNDDDKDEEDEDDATEERPVKKIVFSHSKTIPEPPTQSAQPSDPSSITSPADIYKLYCPRPILKKTKSERDEQRDKRKVGLTEPSKGNELGVSSGAGDAKFASFSSSAQQAFSGKIVERQVIPQETKTQTTQKDEPPKRVSKFRAQRMQQSSS